jgi:CTP synthase
VGFENTLYMHVTFLPHIGATGELKTKPTQHSVRELRSIGIQPDVIIARTDHPVEDTVCDKIALFCDVERRAVIPLKTASTLYEIPLVLEEAGLGDFIVERMRMDVHPPDLEEWRELVKRATLTKRSLPIGLVGKYVELHDAYMSVRESLYHATLAHGWDLDLHYISSEDLERDRGWDELKKVAGIVVPGGFGERGIEGKIKAARWARKNHVPYLGLCLGLQVLIVELARQALDSDEPNSMEFDPRSKHPVIDLMPDQRTITDMGGTMRLGLYPCLLTPGTKAAQAYGVTEVQERHRHRFEVNNAYRDLLSEAGLVFSGLSPDRRLVEIAELADHPFMLGSQFHPEFKSRPTRPHPLFKAFIAAAIDNHGGNS